MEDYNYKSNSNKSKENLPSKKTEKVVTGSVKTNKKSGMQKLADDFIADDIRNVKTYIKSDVLIPAIKKAISDVVKNGIDMIFYGNTSSSGTASKIAYNKKYNDVSVNRRYNSKPSVGFDYDSIVFANRADAEAVLSSMQDIIDLYEEVSVGDLYDLTGISTNDFTVMKYGWSDIHGAQTVRVRDGYVLKLPKALPLN